MPCAQPGNRANVAEARFDVTSLGEMLIRLSVASGQRLEAATHLDIYPAGAEANVLSLLARLEKRTCWFGAVPENPLGRLAANALRAAGVDVSGISWRRHGRMGTYYVEFGAAPRGIQVTYDRAHSCTTQLQMDEIHWDALLDTRVIHLTGITPTLSSTCTEIVLEVMKQAKERGIPVSFDVNYRQKLWTEKEARNNLMPLIQDIELLFCSLTDAKRVFHYEGTLQEIAGQLLEHSHAHYLIMSTGEQGALLWDGRDWHHEPARATQIIDRLGAGDALAAGVIYGWLEGDLPAGLRYGATLAALALTQSGDMVITNRAELLNLAQSDSSLLR